LSSARVQGAQVGGHPAAAFDGAGVDVDGRLHDPFVQAGLMRSAAQGVGEVTPGFIEQMVAREGAAHHVDHGDGVHGGQGDIDHWPPPTPTPPRPPPAPAVRAGRQCRR
jgi:hypothetical protein